MIKQAQRSPDPVAFPGDVPLAAPPGKATLTQGLTPPRTPTVSPSGLPRLDLAPRPAPALSGGGSAGARDARGAAATDLGPARRNPLPYRAEMERAFRTDFSDVRVSTGDAHALASIDARAAAVGEQLMFAEAQPDRRLVAHELAHVMQHRRHGPGSGGISQPGDAAEHEAEAIADAVDAGGDAPGVHQPAVTRARAADSTQPPSPGTLGHEDPAAIPHAAAPASPLDEHAEATHAATTGQAAVADRGFDGDLARDAGGPAVEPPRVGSAHAPASPLDERAGGPRDAEPAGSPAPAASAPSPGASPTGTSAAGPDQAQPATSTTATSTAGPDAAHAATSPDAAPNTARPDAAHPPAATHAPGRHPGDPHDAHAHALPASSAIDSPAPPEERPAAVRTADPARAVLGGAARSLSALDGARLTTLDATTRQVAADAVAAHHVVPEPAPAPGPAVLAASPAPAARGAPRPAIAATQPRARQAIDHPGDRPPPEPTPARPISAGARPCVELHGGADPAHADAARHDGHAQLDAGLSRTVDRSTRDLGVSRLDAPVHVPAPPPVARPVPAPVAPLAVPESPWRKLPAPARARLDERAAPTLRERVVALRARANADDAQAHAELAQTRRAHDQRTAAADQQAHARIAGLRDAGAGGAQTLRARWQAQSVAVRDHTATQLEHDHQAAEAEIQQHVQTSEGRSDAILTVAETDATRRRAAAEARAQQIRSDARARAGAAPGAAAARSPSIARQGGDTDDRAILEQAEADARAEIEQAQREIAALVASAGQRSKLEIALATAAIVTRLTALRLSLATKLHAALKDGFADLEKIYVAQMNTLLDDTQSAMLGVCHELLLGNTQAASDLLTSEQALVERRTQRLEGTLQDAAVLSTFPNVDKALEAFHIDVDGTGWDDATTTRVKEDAIAQAVRLENAFRGVAQPLLVDAGLTAPGAAFNAIMNEGDGIKIKKGSRSGAVTAGGEISIGSFSPDVNDWIANGREFQIGHEFGHAFNASMIYAHLAVADDASTSSTLKNLAIPYDHSAPLKGDRTRTTPWVNGGAFAGVDPITYNDNGTTKTLIDGKTDRNITGSYGDQGMRTTGTPGNGILRDQPYQQDLINDQGEWFADTFVNWSNGTLADNKQGDAIDGWMDDHMRNWIRLALADKKKRDSAPQSGSSTSPGG